MFFVSHPSRERLRDGCCTRNSGQTEEKQLRVLRLLAALVAQDDSSCWLDLEAVEVGADFGVGPVGVAYNFAADVAFAIDDVGLGPAVGSVELGYFLIGVADGVEVDVEAGEEAAVRTGIFVDGNCEDGDVGAVVVQLHERRGFLDTGRALAPPEIQQDNLAAVVGEADGVFAVADGEVGRFSVGVFGDAAAVTCGGEGQEQQSADGDESSKPHVSIIRSGEDRKEGWVK